MKQKTWIIILAVLAAVLVAAAVLIWSGLLTGRENPAEPSAPVESSAQAAPDFTVYTADGQPVKLSDYAGKPVVLNFWASWCGPCKREMPAFEEAYQALGDDVQFLMVNLTTGYETMESATAFLAGTDYTFPVFFDTEGQGNTAYAVSAIPATYFIDEKGNLVASHIGAMDQATLQRYLDKLT